MPITRSFCRTLFCSGTVYIVVRDLKSANEAGSRCYNDLRPLKWLNGMIKKLKFGFSMFLTAVVLLTPEGMALPAVVDADLGENEAKIGKEAAAAIAKENKLSNNAADLKRVREIGGRLARIANEKEIQALYGSSKITPFEYTFNIIEDEDVNAFSTPGGNIYVNTGLLKTVQSDDELAGVIAHEIVHASHHHMVYLLKKQASLDNAIAIALLATMLTNARTMDVNNLLLGVQLYQIAKLNGYGMEAERDSDHGAIILMREAGYNPVGLLTFLERLAKRPELVDYGIYRSHPLDSERVKAARALIRTLGLPINRRATTNAVKAEVKTERLGNEDISGVYISGKLIYRAADTLGKSSMQIARETADRINNALDSGLMIHELKLDPSGSAVIGRNKPLVVVSVDDANLMDKTPVQVARGAAAAIREVIWNEMVDAIN